MCGFPASPLKVGSVRLAEMVSYTKKVHSGVFQEKHKGTSYLLIVTSS